MKPVDAQQALRVGRELASALAEAPPYQPAEFEIQVQRR